MKTYRFKRQDKIALFSGRFDPPHSGHIVAIEDLMMRYLKVIVVICSDSKYREATTGQECFKIMTHHFNRILPPIARNKLEIIVYRQHFGFITKKQLSRLPEFDVYLAGNDNVRKHMKSLGYKTEDVPRSKIKAEGDKAIFPLEYFIDPERIYSGTKVRKTLTNTRQTLREHYGIDIL